MVGLFGGWLFILPTSKIAPWVEYGSKKWNKQTNPLSTAEVWLNAIHCMCFFFFFPSVCLGFLLFWFCFSLRRSSGNGNITVLWNWNPVFRSHPTAWFLWQHLSHMKVSSEDHNERPCCSILLGKGILDVKTLAYKALLLALSTFLHSFGFIEKYIQFWI